ncbi:MAG: cob(I)yrinic acid a,c-diamide adenosyltransferase [Candidatus Kapaibacterium sp.]|nr:cob(I)yrinic acid a,c-diamide adenosyltransferase [Bacteroidota bacterium]
MATKIYTKTGDDGTTGLFGGERLLKYDVRITTYGTVDELNSVIGITLTHQLPDSLREDLTALSSLLFSLGSDLATPLNPPPVYHIPRMVEKHVLWLESRIDEYDNVIPQLKSFILPGGSSSAAYLHLARTVCRRAERYAVELSQREEIGEYPVKFLNRCSDFLFTAARFANHTAGIPDVPWQPEKE